MARLPMHPLEAQWWTGDADTEGNEIGPYLTSGRETSVSAWLEMSAQVGVPSDLSGGQHAHCLATYGTEAGDATVDPQNLMIQPSTFGLDFSGQVPGADFDPPFPGASLESDHLGEAVYYGTGPADAPNPAPTYPEFDPYSPAGDSIPGAPVFSAAFSPVSHVLDN
ncbi:uncharacterized protein B0H64DRAFT_182668 [Chaetomium fimeti]|uniref:Uncharacterized protein n=1 Tax=Chaetomium fimeti TaxID=1854472 RepID=A0AAE0HEL1_9PEZI|nr:hypothetical protein B0H64DRAFT_182668 [Chaetomium fimeti]